MKAPPILPPAPLGASCPLWMLVEWSEVFRNGLASRSKVLLEVHAEEGPASAGERWLALVTWDCKSAHLRRTLAGALHREYRIPDPSGGLDRVNVGELFHRMKSAGQSVWFVDLFRWGGAAIFIRKAADDPTLAKILTFNRQGRPPIKWQLPRHRDYPKELRQAHAERWAAEQKTRISSTKKSPK
ncbi:MAG: hypothetical protein Q8N18_18430 [Opitutaceae bacterium]|nr:hypothetical protein [Opitutaceae bacterium]